MTTSRLWAETALLPEGWAKHVLVEVEGGQIVRGDTGCKDSRDAVALSFASPANLHSHAFQRAMAGMTERRGAGQDSFWTWRKLMYQFLDHLTPEDVQDIAAFVQMQMLEAGYASVGEFHYLHHQPGGTAYDGLSEMSDRIVRLGGGNRDWFDTSCRCCISGVAAMVGRWGRVRRGLAMISSGLGGCGRGPRRHCRHLPADAVLGVAPHSLRAVSREGLAFAAELSPGTPIHISFGRASGRS